MIDVSGMTPDQILAIKQPEAIFPFDIDEAKKLYRNMAKRWHPDAGGDGNVFAHLKELHNSAEQSIAMGFWRGPKALRFRNKHGTEFVLGHKRTRPFELGDAFIGDRFVTYAVKKEFADLAENFVRKTKQFSYASKAMEEEISRYLPRVRDLQETLEYVIVVVEKTPDLFSLRDVASALGGKIPPVHVAWIVSSVLNLLCYLELQAAIVHCDISPDSYFVSPKFHGGALLGGWWYSIATGRIPTAAPTRTLELCPWLRKGADRSVDALCARSMALELLGDKFGSRLLTDKSIPAPMLTWLRSTSAGSALEDYRIWKESVLPKSFGKPKFVELKLEHDEAYR